MVFRISIDLDGVFLQNVPFFAALAESMKRAGCEVGILSCHPWQPLSGVPDDMFDFWYTANALDEAHSKAVIIDKEKIDVSFDDKGRDITMELKKMGKLEGHLIFSNYSQYSAKDYGEQEAPILAFHPGKCPVCGKEMQNSYIMQKRTWVHVDCYGKSDTA